MKKLKLVLQYNYLFFLSIIFIGVYILITTKVIKYHSEYDINDTTLTGILTFYSLNGNTLKMDIKGKEKVKVTYYLKTEQEKEKILENLSLGANILLEGNFKEPSNNTIPNTFNYKKYLYNNKIFYTFTATNWRETAPNNNPFYSVKNTILKRIYDLPYKEYLLIFILGDKSLIDSQEYSNFQLNGTAHLLAISGMHIGLLLSILNKLLSFIKENKRNIVIYLILIFFAFLTGFSASVWRVILFLSLNNLNKKLNLNLSGLQILFITAFILLLINPFYLYNYGFLYSLVITGGIIYYQDKIKGNYLKRLFLLSLITFLFSLPISASLNYEINLLSIGANLITVPLVSFVVYPFSLITLIFSNSCWGILVKLLIFINTIEAKYSLLINIPKLNLIFILIYYVFLVLCKNKRKLIIISIISLTTGKYLGKLDASYKVYFLDVGQGDSSLLISPYQKEVILIDTGGKVTYAEENWQKSSKTYHLSDNTIKFLKSLGITKINYLVLSHGDYDHAGEALNIIKNIAIEKIILNQGEYNKLEQDIIKTGIPIAKKISLNYFPNKILEHQIKDDENANSLINLIKVGNYNFLFLGDSPKEVEEEILNKYSFKFFFLKVAHHGSKTSSSLTLLEQDFPYAFISSGKNNRYNHPSLEVIENLEKYHKKYYNTQDDGSILVKIKDSAYTITCYEP